MLEADLAHDQVRNFLLSQIEGAAWSHDDVYGPDPDAISAIAERRPPRGAVSPAAEICRQLRRAAPPTAACELVADWCGVRSPPKDPVAAGGAAVPGGEDPPASATWGRGLDSLLTRIMERLRQQHR
jgi:hypothetical protein